MSINPPSPQPNGSTSGSNWTEPPWSGWIETTGDALLILEAARRGLIPRVTRRLVDSERKMITSGSVFVFDEDESGIKRWTDGFFWSPSRILGNFLLYRETDKRGAGHRGARSDLVAADTLLVNEMQQYTVDGTKLDGQTLSRPKGEVGGMGIDRHRERSLVGSLTNSYKFKPDGMMKKTFSLTIGGVSQHLISYYKVEDVEQGRLRTPSSLPEIASLDISPEYLDKTHFRNPPKVEYGIDGLPRYRGESDEADASPRAATAPLSTGVPLLLDSRANTDMAEGGMVHGGSGKRGGKRFEPYGTSSPTAAKRARKSKAPQQPVGSDGSTAAQLPQSSPNTGSAQPYAQPDQNVPPHPHYSPYGVPVPNYYPVPPGYAMHPPHPMYSSPPPPPPPGSPYAIPTTAGNNGGQHQTGSATPPATSSSPAPGQPTYGTYAPADGSQQGTGQHYAYFPAPGHYGPYAGVPWTHYTYAPGMVPPHASGAGSDGKNSGDDASGDGRAGVVDVSVD